MENTKEKNEISSVKMELDYFDEQLDEQLSFIDANESINEIENDDKKYITTKVNETVKLLDSTTDESNTEEIKEEIIESIKFPILESTENIINETNLNNNINQDLDIKNLTTSNNIVDLKSNNLDSKNQVINTIYNTILHKSENIEIIPNYNDSNINIPIADIVASTNNDIISKKHVKINDIMANSLDIKLDSNKLLNNNEINIDNCKINNDLEIDQISSNNNTSEISYINKIKKKDFVSNKSFKHIHQNKPSKKKKYFDIDQIDTVYNKLQDYIRNIKIDRTNFFILITKCVEIIENLNNVEENYRKNLAIKSLNRIITVDLNLPSFDNYYIIENVDNCIELIITASKYKSKHDKQQIYMNDNNIFANAGQIIPSILDKIITIILKRRYTVEKIFTNISTLLYILILFCEQYPHLNGIEKKNIVLQTMEQLIHIRLQYIIKITDEKKLELIQALDSISCTIDTLIAIQNNKYNINRKKIMPNKKTLFNCLCLCGTKN